MFEWLKTRLRQGTRTSAFPAGVVELPERFRGLPVLPPGPDTPPLDLGGCLFSPDDAGGAVTYSRDHRMASSARAGLITATGQAELARALDAEMLRLFRRSLRLRSVVTGSCGGCEAELTALSNVVFDLARFGVQFVASPRHADGLVITGSRNRNMQGALRAVYDAMPGPRIVIAVGACAITGGPFQGSPEVGTIDTIPVDLYIPGCPPHPFTVLDGLLRLLGRMPDGA